MEKSMNVKFVMHERSQLREFLPSCEVVIRWLELPKDAARFAEFLLSEQNRKVTSDDMLKWQHDGTEYCSLFVNGSIFARAAVERYSETSWECADVRVARTARNKGYAKQICSFVIHQILDAGKKATISTESDNRAMLKVIASLGFE
jgi:predicted GNAT family acetyltransferase